MAAEWHYGREEPSNGPVSLEELKHLVASGQVQPTDMVWKSGMSEWLPAGEVEQLYPKQGTADEASAAGQRPSVPPERPSDATPALRRKSSSLRTAAVGLSAFCVVGLVVAGSFMFFRSRPLTDRVPPVSPETAEKGDGKKVTDNRSGAGPGSPAVRAGIRKWTRATDGKEFEAEFVDIERESAGYDNVRFRKSNGTKMWLRLSRLSGRARIT